MRLFPSLESALSLEFSSNLPRDWPRASSPFPLEGGRSSSPPADRYATIRRRCICIGRVFRARSVKSIDLEPCLKFTWVMSMKLERILIARLECSSSVYFCTGGMAKLLLFVIRLCKYCAQISYREIYRLFVGRRIELISGNFVQIDGRANNTFSGNGMKNRCT